MGGSFRLLLLLCALFGAGIARAQSDSPADLIDHACYATAPPGPALTSAALTKLPFVCGAIPDGYKDRWLWLRVRAIDAPAVGQGGTLLLNQTRFEGLAAAVGRGAAVTPVAIPEHGARPARMLGGSYRVDLPEQGATDLYLGYDRVADASLIRKLRIAADAEVRTTHHIWLFVGGLFIGMTLTSLVYNLFLFVGLKYPFQAWYCLWTVAVLLYGLAWSNLLQLAFPTFGGNWAVRLTYFASTLTVALGTMFFVNFLEPGTIPARLRQALVWMAGGIALLGAVASLDQLGLVAPADQMLNLLIIATTAATGLGLAVAARRGSDSAYFYAIAWACPFVAIGIHLLWTYGVTPANNLADAGVFGSAAIQAVLLSVAMADRLGKLRRERDVATAEREKMRLLAETDPLTGLYNRRGFVARAQAMLGRPSPDAGLGLILLDVDQFKTVNDEFGHDVGDLVLERIGGALIHATRDHDVAGRLGGEEFGVAVAGIDRETLAALAERVRVAIATLDTALLLGERRRLTISIGVASSVDDPAATFEKLYVAADKALYVAKRSGRNRVSLHSSASLDGAEIAAAF